MNVLKKKFNFSTFLLSLFFCLFVCFLLPPDVLRDQSNENKFWFYEVYENTAAVDFHKTQAHYQAWADFKESGGTVSSVSHKADGEFIG